MFVVALQGLSLLPATRKSVLLLPLAASKPELLVLYRLPALTDYRLKRARLYLAQAAAINVAGPPCRKPRNDVFSKSPEPKRIEPN